jgi:hypothetical protein
MSKTLTETFPFPAPAPSPDPKSIFSFLKNSYTTYQQNAQDIKMLRLQ